MNTPKIVIVEDDPDVAGIIKKVLQDFAFQSLWSRSAGDLFKSLAESKRALINNGVSEQAAEKTYLIWKSKMRKDIFVSYADGSSLVVFAKVISNRRGSKIFQQF